VAVSRSSSSRAATARGERHVGQVGEGGLARPLVQSVTPFVCSAASRLLDQALEAQHIDVRALEQITRWTVLDEAAGAAERPAQRRHVHLDRVRRGRRGIFAPEAGDQFVKLRDLAAAQSELRKDRLLFDAA